MASVTAVADPVSPPESMGKQRTLLQDATRRFFHNRLAVFGLVLVVFFVILALFSALLSPHPYDKVYFDRVLQFPFEHPAHPLGTDEVGRDYLSRLIHGARTSLFVGITVMFICGASSACLSAAWPVIEGASSTSLSHASST